MLHAIIHNKSMRLIKAAHTENSHNEKRSRIPWEDEITATVFGALRYLPSENVYSLFCAMIKQSPIRQTSLATHSVEFWKKKKSHFQQYETQTTELDMLITFQFTDSTSESFIVELKWGKSFHKSTADQLQREWDLFSDSDVNHLIYLAPYVNLSDNDFKQPEWYGITWEQFLGVVQQELQVNQHKSAYYQYLFDIKMFLNKLDIRQFSNFSAFRLPENFVVDYFAFQFSSFENLNLNLDWSIYE